MGTFATAARKAFQAGIALGQKLNWKTFLLAGICWSLTQSDFIQLWWSLEWGRAISTRSLTTLYSHAALSSLIPEFSFSVHEAGCYSARTMVTVVHISWSWPCLKHITYSCKIWILLLHSCFHGGSSLTRLSWDELRMYWLFSSDQFHKRNSHCTEKYCHCSSLYSTPQALCSLQQNSNVFL